MLALDPCVSEEYPSSSTSPPRQRPTSLTSYLRLRDSGLSLDMLFHELHDPRGIARDVTNLGRWGNGDVEVALSSADELPYILGLVRQIGSRSRWAATTLRSAGFVPQTGARSPGDRFEQL